MPVSPGCPASAGCCLLQRSPARANDNVIVYSFKGYDTAKHRYILRPAKATLERIRRIDDAVAVAGSGEELPPSMVDGDGFRRPGTQ
jgi:hypothetical protein